MERTREERLAELADLAQKFRDDELFASSGEEFVQVAINRGLIDGEPSV